MTALDALAGVVAWTRKQVEAFLAGSEAIFLETGASLETLRNEAVSLVATSAEVVRGAQPGDEDPVERLAEGCRRIDLHLATSRSTLETKARRLQRIVTAVERLAAFRPLFRRAASALRMLGMSTSIENARAGMESTGFATVAADVRRLGRLVESRFDDVLDESSSMRLKAAAALVRVNDLTSRQGQRASSMLADANAGLESLRALARTASTMGGRASAVSNRVVDSVTNVVVSLQVHDITRQMIEHALEGLREIDGDLAAASEARHETRPPTVDPHEIGELCRLQISQLRQAKSKLEGALREIPTSLRAMSASARELADETSHLGQGAEGGPLLQGVERGVAHALSTLREQLRHETEIEAAMNQVTGTTAGMLQRLRDVEQIGRTLKIIGLNAGVEAARTTEGGKVLSVLARTIQELSIEVGAHTGAFAGLVHQIASEASSTSGATAHETSDRPGEAPARVDLDADGQTIAGELDLLLENLRSYNGTLVGSIEVLGRLGGSLGRGVAEITSRIQEHARAIAVLGAVEARLDAASAALIALAGPSARGARSARLISASARYTTEAERSIHRAVSGAPSAESAGAEPVAPAGAAKDLGDNVEMF